MLSFGQHVFCSFLALVLGKELVNRFTAQRRLPRAWNRLVTDLADLSTVEVEQDGCRARLRTTPTIDPVRRALGLALPPACRIDKIMIFKSDCRGAEA
jgi:hypothetical protein